VEYKGNGKGKCNIFLVLVTKARVGGVEA